MFIVFERFLDRRGKQITAMGLAAVLLYSSVAAPVAEAGFWQDRRDGRTFAGSEARKTETPPLAAQWADSLPSVQPVTRVTDVYVDARPVEDRAKLNSALERLPASLKSLPAAYGDIRRVSLAKDPRAPLIVLVQDVHGLYSAQKNVAGILESLDHPSLLVGIEGVEGGFDLKRYRDATDEDSRREAGEFLLQKSIINGPEFFGLTAEREPLLWGLEDQDLYMENVEAYRDSEDIAQNAAAVRDNLARALQDAKKVFSPELQALDKDIQGREDGSVELTAFLKDLSVLPSVQKDISAGRFPQVKAFLDALGMETRLDFKTVENQRRDLIILLTDRLNRADLDQLVQLSLAYRAGTVGPGGYYGSLQNLLSSRRISLARYREFGDYIRYVLIAEKIDAGALTGQVEQVKDRAARSLARTSGQKTVFETAEDFRLLDKLMRHELTSDEWRRYESRRTFLARLPERLGLEGGDFRAFLPVYEAFYAAASKRDRVLVDNLMKKIGAPGQSPAAVMITGGFHTPALEKEIAERNMSCVTIMPKLEVTSPATAYLGVFSRHRTPLEQLLLGDKLMTNPPSVTAIRVDDSFGPLRRIFQSLWCGLIAVVALSKGKDESDVRRMVSRMIDEPVTVDVHEKGEHTRVVLRFARRAIEFLLATKNAAAQLLLKRELSERPSILQAPTGNYTLAVREGTLPSRFQFSVLGPKYAGYAHLWEWAYHVPFLNLLIRPVLERMKAAGKIDVSPAKNRSAWLATVAGVGVATALWVGVGAWAAFLVWALADAWVFSGAHVDEQGKPVSRGRRLRAFAFEFVTSAVLFEAALLGFTRFGTGLAILFAASVGVALAIVHRWIDRRPPPPAISSWVPQLQNIAQMREALKDENSGACGLLLKYYEEDWKMRRDRLDSALARFQELYPRVRDVVISRGAGRSTFLDHNDHGDGTAIGFPVRQDDLVIMGYNPDGDEIALNNMEPRVFSEGSIRASDVAGLRIQKVASKSQMKWTDYCAAILQETLRTLNTYGVERLPGLCVLVDGREEMGGVAVESNMSSSAALEMGITYGVEALVGIAGRLSGTEMTEIGRRAEAAIGFPCGKLDQTCSTGDRARVNPEDRVVVAIHCIPSLTPDGRDATHTTVSKMPTLPGINVNTGEKGPAQREYNIRVIEGEIASWILARKLEELSPGFARLTRAEVENAFPRVNPDHNGKPYLYDADRLYPVFLKPAFFSRPFLAKLGIDVSRQDLYAWVKRNLPQEADGLTEEELIGRYGVPREYFENVTRSARESGIDLNGRRYKLYGSLLHIIDDEDRGVEMAKVLEDAVTKTGRERETALDRFGQLEQDAYHSLAQSFGNSTERIDKFVAWAVTRPWCRAGRHFGAGWGGFLQNWVREGMEASAMTDIRGYLSGQDWFVRMALDQASARSRVPAALGGLLRRLPIYRRKAMEAQLRRGVVPVKPGAPTSLMLMVPPPAMPEKVENRYGKIERLTRDGHDVIRLEQGPNDYVDVDLLGGTPVAFRRNGTAVLSEPKDLSKDYGGAPSLYPFANRMEGGKAPVPGRFAEIDLSKSKLGKLTGRTGPGNKNGLHGCLAKLPARLVGASVDGSGISVTLETVVDDSEDAGFGHSTVRRSFRLKDGQLTRDMEATNTGREAQPLMDGWHPNVDSTPGTISDPENWTIEAPVASYYQTDGELIPLRQDPVPVEGHYDLTTPQPLNGISGDGFDTVFVLKPDAPGGKSATAILRNTRTGLVVKLHINVEENPYFVFWTGQKKDGMPMVGFEAQMYPTDALNMAEAGFGEVRMVKPGESIRSRLVLEAQTEHPAGGPVDTTRVDVIPKAEQDVLSREFGADEALHAGLNRIWENLDRVQARRLVLGRERFFAPASKISFAQYVRMMKDSGALSSVNRLNALERMEAYETALRRQLEALNRANTPDEFGLHAENVALTMGLLRNCCPALADVQRRHAEGYIGRAKRRLAGWRGSFDWKAFDEQVNLGAACAARGSQMDPKTPAQLVDARGPAAGLVDFWEQVAQQHQMLQADGQKKPTYIWTDQENAESVISALKELNKTANSAQIARLLEGYAAKTVMIVPVSEMRAKTERIMAGNTIVVSEFLQAYNPGLKGLKPQITAADFSLLDMTGVSVWCLAILKGMPPLRMEAEEIELMGRGREALKRFA